MIHRVTLSNGRVLRLEERKDGLHLSDEEAGEAGSFICMFSADGVLVYPNSGDAVVCLTNGLLNKRVPENVLLTVAKRVIQRCEVGAATRQEYADGKGSLSGCTMTLLDIREAAAAIEHVTGERPELLELRRP